MNRVRNLITISAFALMVLALPAIASAQWGGQNDPYGRNGSNGGYNNGGYGDTRSTVRSLKERTRQFVNALDRELDRSRVDGTRREDQINEVADRFRDAVNALDNDNSQNQNEVRRVFDRAADVDRVIGRGRVGGGAQSLWAGIRNDLQYLGNGYYDNNNRNNRNNRNSNRYPQTRNSRNNLPNWWPF